MKNRLLGSLATVLLALMGLLAPRQSQADNINGVTYLDGVTVHSFSSEINWPGVLGYRAAANTINRSGLNLATGVHNGTAVDEWMTRGTMGWAGNGISPDYITVAATDSFIIYDLGATVNLARIHVWNFDEGADHSGNIYGVQNVNIAASPDLTFGAGTDMVFAKETTSLGADYAFTASGVRYVRFNASSNHGGGGNLTGLAEVAFQIPEPGSLTMLGLLGGTLLLRRWRGWPTRL